MAHQVFANEGRTIACMMKKVPQVPMPFWQFYITVDAIDAAVERVKTHGGKITNGRIPCRAMRGLSRGSIRKGRNSR